MSTPKKRGARPKIPNPHDRLFKDAFRHKEVARDALRSMLEPALLPYLDLGRLEVDETELMDAFFSQLYSDRLFKVPFKSIKGLMDGFKEGKDKKDEAERCLFVWVLFEHQSLQDPMIAVRVIEYGAAKWRRFRMMHPKSREIPALIPIVIQHDPKGWTGSVRLSDHYMHRDILRKTMGSKLIDFELSVEDLEAFSEAELAARCTNPLLRAVLLALKARGVIPEERTPSWRPVFQDVMSEGNKEVFRLLIWYLLVRGSKRIVSILAKEEPVMEQEVRTVLDEKFDEGWDGGEQAGARRIIKRFLKARNFEVSAHLKTRLTNASVETLEEWSDRLFDGEDPNDVFNSN